MVDVVVNNVMATSTTPDLSPYMFKEQVRDLEGGHNMCADIRMAQSQYHPYCPIQWGNTTSEQDCWLGDTNVTLPDLDTQNPSVVSGYSLWIKELVEEYQIDGLRIDGKRTVSEPISLIIRLHQYLLVPSRKVSRSLEKVNTS